MLPTQRLKVVCNPFAVPLDHHGRPCGFVLYDPAHSGGFARYIGATLQRETIEKRPFAYSADRSKMVTGGQLDRVDNSFKFDLTPVEIVDTRYHRRAIQNGVLVPADEKTARMVGQKFAAPNVAIEKAKTERISEWEAQHGEKPPVSEWAVANMPQKASDK